MDYPLPLLGSWFKYSQTDYNLVNGTFTQIARPNPNRWSIQLSNNGAVACFVTFGAARPDLIGIPITQNTLPLLYAFDNYGGLVQDAWYATCNPAAATLEVVEVLYMPPAGPQTMEQPSG